LKKIVVHHKRNSSGSGSLGLFIGRTFDESTGEKHRPKIQKLSRGSGGGSGDSNIPKSTKKVIALSGMS